MARRPTPTTVSVHVSTLLDVVLGTAFLAVACVVVFVLRIGGVVATVTADHGIHSGDFAAIPAALLGAAFLLAAFRRVTV